MREKIKARRIEKPREPGKTSRRAMAKDQYSNMIAVPVQSFGSLTAMDAA